MSLGGCDCCGEPPCADPVLEEISVSRESPMCGVRNPEDGLYYLVTTETFADFKIETTTYSTAEDGSCESEVVCSGGYTITYTPEMNEGQPGSVTGSQVQTFSYDPETCEQVVTCSGAITYSNSSEGYSATWTETYGADCNPVVTGSVTVDGESTPLDSVPPWGAGYYGGGTLVYDPESATPGIEYSSAAPTTFENPPFPEYPEWGATTFEPGQAAGGGAERRWDDSTRFEKKFKYRITHAPTGTCYLKVWLRKTTEISADAEAEPPIEASITHDDEFEQYEWSGTGNPCLTVELAAVDSDENKIIGEEAEILTPTENSEITISILKFSCVEGYEPDISDEENPQPNGYPDPTWEPAAP